MVDPLAKMGAVDFDLAIVFEQHAAGKDDVFAEAIEAITFGDVIIAIYLSLQFRNKRQRRGQGRAATPQVPRRARYCRHKMTRTAISLSFSCFLDLFTA
jgi:hypothetical protein